MGRMLGTFADDNELDRPDLNKCPDCKCYFAGDNCPLCGKVCPEEMRAGNRKAVKVKKQPNRNQAGRVTFVSWYHSWWFILLMMWFMPIVGVILLVTSPHKKWIKITAITLAILYVLFISFGLGGRLLELFDRPVDTSLSKEEYIATCVEVDPEIFYRSPDSYDGEFVTMTLMVEEQLYSYSNSGQVLVYYRCSALDGKEYDILVRNCILEGTSHFVVGDRLIVYGEGDGIQTAMDAEYRDYTAPCINVAYAKLVRDE